MGRPEGGYKIDGQRVPGVTTIAGRYKESGGLLAWAWQQGRDGKDFRESRDAAADAGTCCHTMIEADWHGKVLDRSTYKPEVLAKADHAFLAYLQWKEQTKLEIIKPELTLLSKKYLFGGTLDAILVQGKLCLGDWKTSGGIYSDMLIQVAGGYSLLYQENFPKEEINGVQIIRFAKPDHPDDPITFAHHYWSAEVIPLCQRQFILFREAYDYEKRIKKLL